MEDRDQECPLCLELFSIDDINFYPCECRYQICRFCWHRIRTDEDGRCPHCRLSYSENPAEYTPPSPEQITRLKEKGKKKNQEKKQKLVESRKNLAEVRVVQKNLVFVIGLSPRLADPEVLKKQEYFGKFGKIFKVVINNHTVYSGQQGPSVSAYVTYNRTEDASKAIQTVNNAFIDGRYLKASYGTTKYCSYFLRGVVCPKPDCMYLHELGEEEASFTKEDMQLGKHQEYEHATLVAVTNSIQSKEQYQDKNLSKNKQTSSVSKPSSTSSGTESALPSSANWGSKVEKSHSRSKDKYHSNSLRHQYSVGHSHSHHSNPPTIQRSNSHPSKYSTPVSRRGSRSSDSDDRSRDSSVGRLYKLGSPNSRSSSVESLRSLSSSGGSSGGYSGGVVGGRSKRDQYENFESTGFNKNIPNSSFKPLVARTVSEPFDKTYNRYGEIPKSMSLRSSSTSESCDVVTDGRMKEEKEEDWDEDETCEEWEQENEEEEENVEDVQDEDDDDDDLSIDVLKTLSSAGEFGSLGVSWQTGQSDPQEGLVDGVEYMPMMWGQSKLGESNLLANILNGRDPSSPPKPNAPIDEKQRLASVSYVNYGPTTNNGISEHQVLEISQKPCEGTGEMLRSTLEDGFKTLFPSIQNSFGHSVQTSTSGQTRSQYSSDLFHHRFWDSQVQAIGERRRMSETDGFDKDVCTSEWPDLTTSKQHMKPQTKPSTIAPPPGFGPQKPRESHTTPSTSNNIYSLWGNSGSVQGLFQQNDVNSTQTTISSSKPAPAGAIPANVLEASLFANPGPSTNFSGPSHFSGPSSNYLGSMAHPTVQQQQQQQQQLQKQILQQQQLHKQQQHQQQMHKQFQQQQHFQKQIQQQQMFLHQQRLHQQRQQQLLQANMSIPNTNTSSPSIGTVPGARPTAQRPVNPYFPPTAYHGSWLSSAQLPYGWGMPRPLTMNTGYGQNMMPQTQPVSGTGSMNKLVNPVQWTSQTGLKPPLQPGGLEKGLQSMHIK